MEILAQFLLEIVAYGVGRVFVAIFLPWYRVQPVSRHDPKDEQRWKWRGFSYLDAGRRVMRTESVQLIGIVVTIAVAAMLASLLK